MNYPFGDADVLSPTLAATMTLNLTDGGLTLVNIPSLTEAVTLRIGTHQCRIGTRLIVRWILGASAFSVTFSSSYSFDGAVITGTASKTNTAIFEWVGDKFILTGNSAA